MKPQRRFHVSNRAALVAALILAISTFISFRNSTSIDPQYEEQVVVAASQADSSATSNKRKLSISLLLFGRG
jgi:hypothetical protein